ncbi:hypothetical protein F2Q69_00027633 [Brassica cretica]|uniref:Uncharacterized protein n=1 Tax=Brassica cretica TaxID=69181 RepID=A0A8S9S7I1_BRACR|nr:hypothetical protein F2Q69_00027633 [Brassica cretica]
MLVVSAAADAVMFPTVVTVASVAATLSGVVVTSMGVLLSGMIVLFMRDQPRRRLVSSSPHFRDALRSQRVASWSRHQ